MPTMPTWTPNETQYFDISPQGVRTWKEPYRSQILTTYLTNLGVTPAVPGDVTVVQVVESRSTMDATAARWAAQFGQSRVILACRWMLIQYNIRPQGPAIPEYLRAVAPGEELQWAGPAANAMYAVLTVPTQGGGGAVPVPNPLPSVPPPPPAPDAFSGLPDGLAGECRALMRDSTDPAKLRLIADSLEGKYPGDVRYQHAADALRARAKELQLEQETRAIQQNRMYIVRGNDLQSEVALWFTGDANRWKELGKTNPNLRMMRQTDGDKVVEYFAPWVAGQKVLLPSDWDTSKGMPPIKPRTAPRAS
ncbi:MAG: hypothetical protein E6Q97_20500 [Desulfurellales bacterium]|nr:MAG: hypothetical protein E6Q97_20500 [Desulfurellales bacterium]